MTNGAYAGDISPSEAWEILEKEPEARLVDVRTPAEWSYVGVPDLRGLGKEAVFIPWLSYPDMQVNARFVDYVNAAGVSPQAPVLLLCRSGVRSRSAAIALTAKGFGPCYNVVSGFEGDHDPAGHRGTISGWKVENLPWVQG